MVSRFRSRQTASLLAYLATHRDRRHAREVLVELLWPECEIRVGLSRLSTAVWSLRRKLESEDDTGHLLEADRQSVGVSTEGVVTDVAEFEAAIASARATEDGTRRASLTRAVELYRGEFLPGYYED